MFDKLDDINWAGLNHAYGPAIDVPEQLYALAGSDEDAYDDAIFKLHENIWHQGTVYEATAYAVPFLIELAAAVETLERHTIVSYLGLLAEGSSYIDAHQDVVPFSAEDLQVKLPQEIKWVEQTRDAVKAGEAVYLECLSHDDQALVCAAVYVLSRFSQMGKRYWPIFEQRYKQAAGNFQIRFSIATAAHRFTDNPQQLRDWIDRQFLHEENDLMRTALTLSLAQIDPELSKEKLQPLIDNLLSDDDFDAAYRSLGFDAPEPMAEIAEVLCRSAGGRQWAVERFNELLKEKADPDRLNYCYTCLLMELYDPADMPAGQKAAHIKLPA